MQRRALMVAPLDGPPGGRATAGAMARRRRLTGRPVLVAIFVGAVVTGLLVQIISLANSVHGLRADIACIDENREYLRAEVARLTRSWNEVTAPEVVIRRAGEELGLVVPDGATPVVVMLEDAGRGRSPAWRRLLATAAPPPANARGFESGLEIGRELEGTR